jgi:hypothetical protein
MTKRYIAEKLYTERQTSPGQVKLLNRITPSQKHDSWVVLPLWDQRSVVCVVSGPAVSPR